MVEEGQEMEMSMLYGVTALGEVDQRQGCTFVLSPEFLQQHLGLLEIRRVKALREPAVERREQLAGLIPLALLLPEPTQAQSRPQFPGGRLLAAGDLPGPP